MFSRAFAGTRQLSTTAVKNGPLLFRQLIEYQSYTYTYLLADRATNEAIIIDPVIEMVNRDAGLVEDLKLKLKYAVNTHAHADHVTGTGLLKKQFQDMKSVLAEASGGMADMHVKHHDKLSFGEYELEVRSTPGHTNGCISFVLHKGKMCFTGDALLIRGCGRTDFQQGDSKRLYRSVHNEIFSLPDDYLLYPGHDYTGQTVSSVAEEKKLNSRLIRSEEEFSELMKNLKLPYPKQIDKALPLNMVCGLQELLKDEKAA